MFVRQRKCSRARGAAPPWTQSHKWKKKRSSFKASARPVYEIYLGVYSHRNTAKADAVKAQSTTAFTGIYEGKQPPCKHKPGLQENPIPIVLTQFLNWVETHKPVKVFSGPESVFTGRPGRLSVKASPPINEQVVSTGLVNRREPAVNQLDWCDPHQRPSRET